MIELRSVAEIRAAEAVAHEQLPDGALMQRAVAGIVATCVRLIGALGADLPGTSIVVLAGAGDNGGDALWTGARLADRGCRVDVIAMSDRLHEAGLRAVIRAGGRVHSWDDTDVRLHARVAAADLILDGLVGIGAVGPLRAGAAAMAALAAQSQAVVVAVDVPSGVLADTGAVEGAAVMADITVACGAVKPGLLVFPGAANAGEVVSVDIGLVFDEPAEMHALESIDVADWLPEPKSDSYKYRRGVVGVCAGSGAYPGAGLLAVGSARRGNVGMVRYLDRSDGVAPMVVGAYPDVVVDGTDPADQQRVDAWVCGPGFPGSPTDAAALAAILAVDRPVVVDAGALTVLDDSLRATIADRNRRGQVTVLTPHEGEFERIFPGLLARGRLSAATSAAAASGAVVVLKGPGTIICGPDGDVFVDTEGTADLATSGSGDVLTGLVGAILAGAWSSQRRTTAELVEATAAAVWLHGVAGQIAAEDGPVVAPDIAGAVGAAVLAARFGSVPS